MSSSSTLPRVLVLCSGRHLSEAADLARAKPYVHDQVTALQAQGLEVEVLAIPGRGVRGYAQAVGAVAEKAAGYDLVHAHFGLCGLAAGLARRCPVVTTFHGSDVNDARLRKLSIAAAGLSAWRIFVADELRSQMPGWVTQRRSSVLACGVDTEVFRPRARSEARAALGWDEAGRKVLFAGSFSNPVKDPGLAKEAVAGIEGVELVELKGYTREQVALVMNACDALLLTSHREGSPQVVKEAIASNLPVVSVDVGDVKRRLEPPTGVVVTSRSPDELGAALCAALSAPRPHNGSVQAAAFSNSSVAEELIDIYQRTLAQSG